MPFKTVPPLYTVWQGMRRRCLNTDFKQWKDYGGRGITICPEWDSYERFASDMGTRPTPQHTLERKDNDKPYCKENCKWATRKEQAINKRNIRFVTIEGVEYKAWELSEKFGVKADTIINRAAEGLSFEACTTPGYLNFEKSGRSDQCKNGHQYTPENTKLLRGRTARACRECLRATSRLRYADAKDGPIRPYRSDR
jgi:hypothetical protein